MAEFPIQRAPERLGVVPATAVRADLDVSTGGQELGRAVAGFGGAISDLGEEYDITQAQTQLSEFQRKSNEEINRLTISFSTNLDPETYQAEYKKSLATINTLMPSNRRAARNAQIWLNTKEPAWFRDVNDAREARVDDNWMAELFTKQTVVSRSGQMGTFPAFITEGVAAGRIDKSDAVKILAQTNKKAEKGQITNLYMAGQYDVAKQAVEASQILTPEEKADMQNTIRIARQRSGTKSELALNAALVDVYSKIRDGATDLDAMMDAIQSNPIISNEDKLAAAEKIPTYFNKINSIVTATVSDSDAYDLLTQATELEERGTMSPVEFEELYADKKHLLDKDDRRAIRSKDIVATKTMQNRAFTDAMSATLPTLVELTESELGALKLARQNAEIIKDLPRVNFFNIAIKKNQAERWNYGRFRKQLRLQIDQNPEWSQKQIYVAQEILTEQLDMPVSQLLKEFDGQNPRQAIMKTPPNKDFKDIWKDLPIDDKAIIWELSMRGVSPEEIIGAIE